MQTMFSFSKKKDWNVFVILVVINIFLISMREASFIKHLQSIQDSLFYPLRMVTKSIGHTGKEIVGLFHNKDSIRNKLKQKEKEVIFYKHQLAWMTLMNSENIRLKQLLKLKNSYPNDSILAEVISTDPEYSFSSLQVNKGSVDGVIKGSAVVTESNKEIVLLGIVKQVSPFTSRIETFKNKDFRLGVLLVRTGINAVAQGSDKNLNNINLLYVDRSVNLLIGEEVLTSPFSTIFPPYIKIGRVSAIETTDRSRMSYYATIQTYANLNQVLQVFILKNNKK